MAKPTSDDFEERGGEADELTTGLVIPVEWCMGAPLVVSKKTIHGAA